jgi:hypothetical protein
MEKVLVSDDDREGTIVVEIPGTQKVVAKEQREPIIKKGKMHVNRYRARRRKMKMQAESRRRNR